MAQRRAASTQRVRQVASDYVMYLAPIHQVAHRLMAKLELPAAKKGDRVFRELVAALDRAEERGYRKGYVEGGRYYAELIRANIKTLLDETLRTGGYRS